MDKTHKPRLTKSILRGMYGLDTFFEDVVLEEPEEHNITEKDADEIRKARQYVYDMYRWAVETGRIKPVKLD